jgi:hypothetical protein
MHRVGKGSQDLELVGIHNLPYTNGGTLDIHRYFRGYEHARLENEVVGDRVHSAMKGSVKEKV